MYVIVWSLYLQNDELCGNVWKARSTFCSERMITITIFWGAMFGKEAHPRTPPGPEKEMQSSGAMLGKEAHPYTPRDPEKEMQSSSADLAIHNSSEGINSAD